MSLAIVIHTIFIIILISKYASSQGDSNLASISFFVFVVAALIRFSMDGYIFKISFCYFKFVVVRRIEIMRKR